MKFVQSDMRRTPFGFGMKSVSDSTAVEFRQFITHTFIVAAKNRQTVGMRVPEELPIRGDKALEVAFVKFHMIGFDARYDTAPWPITNERSVTLIGFGHHKGPLAVTRCTDPGNFASDQKGRVVPRSV